MSYTFTLCDLKLNYMQAAPQQKPQCFFSQYINTLLIIIAFHANFVRMTRTTSDKMLIILYIKFNDTNQMKMILKWKTRRRKTDDASKSCWCIISFNLIKPKCLHVFCFRQERSVYEQYILSRCKCLLCHTPHHTHIQITTYWNSFCHKLI